MATLEQIQFTMALIQNQYPQYAAYMQIPDLANAITDAMINGSGPGELQGAIYNTQWYKNTPDQARNFLLLQTGDRVSADAQISIKAEQIRGQLQAMGIPYEWGQLRNYAYFALAGGASDQQIMQEAVGQFTKGSPSGNLPGVVGNNATAVKTTASQYAVPLSDDQARFFAVGLSTGATSQAVVDDFMRDQAKSMYPYLTTYLDAGYTVKQFADPYIQQAANELEINPASIDLTDPKWGRVLQPHNDAPMTLYDWQRTYRTDPSYGWDKTTGARTTAAQFTSSLAKTFGVMG